MEFAFVGIEKLRERVIESNRTVGCSNRGTTTVFPHTTRDTSSDRPPKGKKLVEWQVQVERNGRFAPEAVVP
jgi:hypothetical protein